MEARFFILGNSNKMSLFVQWNVTGLSAEHSQLGLETRR